MKKYILGITAIAIAVFASSFTVKKSINPFKDTRAIQTWYFHGTMLSQDLTASNYSTTAPTCSNGDNLPCEIQYDSSQFSSLQTYLNAEGSDTQVRDDAVSTKK